MRLGSLSAMAMPMRPSPPCANVGRPPVSRFQVVPPSVDLKRPLLGPENAPFSHGPCCACHSTAYTFRGLRGSNARSIAPVRSSLYSTFFQFAPPSVDLNTPRSVLGP